MREDVKRCLFIFCGCVWLIWTENSLYTPFINFHSLQFMNYLHHIVLLLSHFWVTNPALLYKASKTKKKICSVLLQRVIKAVTLPFDQTNKGEDFRILIRKYLPFTTFSFNVQATTLLILKPNTLGITTLLLLKSQGI